MADRYQDRPFPADDGYNRGGDQHSSGRGESDPLAELARLIGQTDPFGAMGRTNQRVNPQAAHPQAPPPRANVREQYQPAPPPPPREPEPEDDGLPAGPPPWLQRANRQDVPQQDYQTAPHPLQRQAAPRPEPEYEEQQYAEPQYADEPAYADADPEPDPSRYDDALYGQLGTGAQQDQGDQAYADDGYAYQDDGYDDEEQAPKRRSGMVTVVVLLALAVVGTGAAFAYRNYMVSSRSGEPPIIRADAGPTKIVPAPPNGSTKLPDRLTPGDGTEKIVPREEAPVDVNAQAGPRVVFPPLNQNGNPPPAASVASPGLPPSSASNGTLPNTEPRKIKVQTVRGDQADAGAAPAASAPPPPPTRSVTAAKTAAPPPAPRNPPSSANASANTPLSLVPGSQPAAAPAPAAEPRTRVAATNPTQTAPSAGSAGGNFMVQVSSQKSEADAQASYQATQGKYPGVLGSYSPLIKRVDLGEKGIYYRAMVGPFGSNDEAARFCSSLKTAGGQCLVQRN
jgi:SPOR domain